MIQIILNDAQVQAVKRASGGAIELRDEAGALLGFVAPPIEEKVIAEARRRANSAGPWFTTSQVVDHLNSLGSK